MVHVIPVLHMHELINFQNLAKNLNFEISPGECV